VSGDDSCSQVIAEAESSRKNNGVEYSVEFVMPYQFRVKLQTVSQDVDRVAVAVASWELYNGYLQFPDLIRTLSE
jgi:hypothetical protein